MARPATLTIDLDSIAHNYQIAISQAPEQKALAVVKANAYGHGAVDVAQKLEPYTPGFAVACIEEAIELREAGIRKPILLLEGFFSADELDYICRHNIWTAVHNDFQLEAIASAKLTEPVHVWLKLNTGMNRLGFTPDGYKLAYKRLGNLPQVSSITLLSHLTSADNPASPETEKQIERFNNIHRDCPSPRSIANSAGTMKHPLALHDWQRPGIILYGSSPFSGEDDIQPLLQPAMTLTSEIIAVHELQPGDAVGYNGTWVCERPTRIGTVALGYADGYPRQARNGTPVLVNGQRTQLIGRVSMDMLTVDLTGLDAGLGSAVELWGKNLLANEVAPWCGTISYTLFTGITRRVHREVKGAICN
ncbi:alanine racemase [Marinobacter alexandrii]|uniref:alanine racemase n=1 Tax=Marinobacter alexandrii TaxID=2570351 RepID=UPI00110997EB|nr:alanine racemase [Marinobacter alexandrii]